MKAILKPMKEMVKVVGKNGENSKKLHEMNCEV